MLPLEALAAVAGKIALEQPDDAAGQQVGGGQGTEQRINVAFLENGHALVGIRQLFGYFVTIGLLMSG